MEKRHRCKLCFRNFGSGRALGGHMRSHMITNSYDQPQQQDDDADYRSFSSTSLSSSSEMDQDFYDRDSSETEHPKKQRRSKRVPISNKRLKITDDNSSLSSISDTTPEEQVARSLIMLSRDNWTREIEFDSNAAIEEVVKPKVIRGGKYRCDECNKMFKSYQALGGHRASHKKIRAHAPPSASKPGPAEVKVHNCPFCQRVFASGQALGGHKRSHFICTNSPGAVVQNSIKVEALKIDLNLPAPVDDEEISQVAVSDVC